MLTHEDICSAVSQLADKFPIKKVAYFGSYADSRQTETSDLDILVEFHQQAVSLLLLSAIKEELEKKLKITVDVVHSPLPENSLITVDKAVKVYG